MVANKATSQKTYNENGPEFQGISPQHTFGLMSFFQEKKGK